MPSSRLAPCVWGAKPDAAQKSRILESNALLSSNYRKQRNTWWDRRITIICVCSGVFLCSHRWRTVPDRARGIWQRQEGRARELWLAEVDIHLHRVTDGRRRNWHVHGYLGNTRINTPLIKNRLRTHVRAGRNKLHKTPSMHQMNTLIHQSKSYPTDSGQTKTGLLSSHESNVALHCHSLPDCELF